LKIKNRLFSQIKPLLFFFIAIAVIKSRGHQINDLFKTLFINNRKDILSLYFKIIFRTIKRALIIISFRKQRKKKSKVKKILRG